MSAQVENAIKLAILAHPETFGLTPAAVNPMLRYILERIEEGEEQTTVDTWQTCFEVVSTVLHQKVIEVLTGLSLVQAEVLSLAEPEPQPGPVPAKPAAKRPRSDKPANNGAVIGSPGRVLSTKQLRYLGYLIRQTGQEPDYSVISQMTQQQATMQIKDLEAKVKGEAAAG